ncbi:hypothetical protein EAF00_001460 [Botryotinia globosa]|nr:hypothetical protein EAF00_001460 [Botryotinia globosa]
MYLLTQNGIVNNNKHTSIQTKWSTIPHAPSPRTNTTMTTDRRLPEDLLDLHHIYLPHGIATPPPAIRKTIAPQKPIQRSYSPLPKPPIGPIPTSRAPSLTPPRPPPRAQTYPSAHLYASRNSTPRHPESRKSQGNYEQEKRERLVRKGVQYEELKRDKERIKKADKRWGKMRRVERDCNRSVDRSEVRSSGAVDRGFRRDGEQGYLVKTVGWRDRFFEKSGVVS